MIGFVIVILIIVTLGATALIGGGGAKSSTNTGTPTTTASSSQSTTINSSSSSSSSANTRSSSSCSSTTSTTTSTSQSQGSPLQITVSKTISDPPEASTGENAYIYDVALTNTGSVSYDVNPSYFTLVTASNSVYDSTSFLAIRQSLSAVTLNHGQCASGQIAFQIPNTQVPSRLEFKDQIKSVDEFVVGLPQPMVWVSEPVRGRISLTGGESVGLSAAYTFSNSTLFYYTGDVIALEVALNDFHISGSIALFTLTLPSSDTGFTLLSINPPLPAVVDACCSDVDLFPTVNVYIYIVAPSSTFTGAIDLVGTTN